MAPKAAKTSAPKAKKEAGDKVKRAPSPYIVFCTEKRPEIKAENPDATFGQLGKLLGEKWASLSEAQKKVWRTSPPLLSFFLPPILPSFLLPPSSTTTTSSSHFIILILILKSFFSILLIMFPLCSCLYGLVYQPYVNKSEAKKAELAK